MKLIITGGPGSGKGTQAMKLSQHFQIPSISTGELLRNQAQKQDPLGLQIHELISNGQMVSDELIIQLLQVRLAKLDCQKGFILDGFPRNIEQAKILTHVVGNVDRIIFIDTPDSEILERLAGRLTCPACGAMFHKINHKPEKDGICDICGTTLIQRKDDNVETIKNRIQIFQTVMKPMIEFFQEKQLLLTVSGLGNMDEISKRILSELKE